MEARAESLRFLGDGNEYTVPFFQRNYVWNVSNWRELLDSFDNIKNETPFLGSIIIKEAGSLNFDVIDGQQRLTTITILAKAIFDTLNEKGSNDEDGITWDIKTLLFYRKNSSDKFNKSQLRLCHSRIDRNDYERVLKSNFSVFGEYPTINIAEELLKLDDEDVDLRLKKEKEDKSISPLFNTVDGNIIKCYKYFMLKLKNRTVQQLHDLHDAIWDNEKKVFVVIKLGKNDINEQQIFDTINRAGVRLSTAEIIKNNIFKRCLETCEDAGKSPEDVYNLYDTFWEAVFYTEQAYKHWEKRRIFGNVERTNLEFLLYCVASIKWRKEKDIFSQLDKFYAERIQDYTYSELNELICDISYYARIFKDCILSLQDDLSEKESMPSIAYDNHIERLLLILEKFGVQMFYPYILKRFRDCEIEELKSCRTIALDTTKEVIYKNLIHDLSILSSFVVRRRLAGKGVNDYATKCDKILHEQDGLINELIREMSDPLSEINDKALATAIQTVKNNENAKIILYNIELYRRKDKKHDIRALIYDFTLEHILPKKWEKHWSDVETYDRDEVLVQNAEEMRAVRGKAILSLGNMLLLTSKLNTSISNNTFGVKIDGNDGYKRYCNLYLTTEIISWYDSGKTVWDERRIFEREKLLLGDILKIWPDFSEEMPSDSPKDVAEEIEEIRVESFSEEMLGDPIKLLTAIDQKGNDENISSNDLYQDFLDFVMKMTMSYSYKPVLIKALLAISDEEGASSLDAVVEYFKKYYGNRRANGLFVEVSDSAFAKEKIDDDLARKTIITYPYGRFKERGFMDLINGNIVFNRRIWNKLTAENKELILANCEEKLEQYYKREHL